MNFKLKAWTVLTLIYMAFAFCCFNVYANHQAKDKHDITYSFKAVGSRTFIHFGNISTYLQQNYLTAKPSDRELPRLVSNICKNYKISAIMFDNTEYIYDENTATLTITGREGSLYATVQSFILEGLNLTNEDEIKNQKVRWVREALDSTNRLYPCIKDSTQQNNYFIQEYENVKKRKMDTLGEGVFKTKPLRAVIIKGNIIRIGDNFCNACTNDTLSELGAYLPVEFLDLSQSNVSQICEGAFSGCKRLSHVILPDNNSLRQISKTAFAGCPAAASLPLNEENLQDPLTPVNYLTPAPKCSCGVL